MNNGDVKIVRDLARRYRELTEQSIQEDRRRLWTLHHSLQPTQPLILVTYGMWNVWCREVFGDDAMKCEDPFWRGWERHFRMAIFHDQIGDDYILEPWVSVGAVHRRGWGNVWGVQEEVVPAGVEGGAWHYKPVIAEWSDISKLSWPPHDIDEEATQANLRRVQDAFGDIIAVDVARGPICRGFLADISTCLAKLRGLEQIMIDMYESPAELHRLLSFMRDGILANQEAAEKAGDFSLTTQENQAMPYARELEPPAPNSGPRQRRDLWGFGAAQEYTLISPAMHEEFLFQYQMPILKHYGLVHYGCCEDLTHKIDMLRKLPNLRSIAVTPRANVGKSAERIGSDYVISWRPNPADMVCADWNEQRIRRILREGLSALKGTYLHLHLKDIETVQGDPDRLRRWTIIAREECERCG